MFRFLLLILVSFAARAEESSLLLWHPKGFDFPFLIARKSGESGVAAAERYLANVASNPELVPFAQALREAGPAEFTVFTPGSGLTVAGQALATTGSMSDVVAHAARMHRTLDPLVARAAENGVGATAVIRLPAATAGLTSAEASAFEKTFGAAFDGYIVPGSASDLAPVLYGQKNRFAVTPNLTLGRELVENTKTYLKYGIGKLYGICFGLESTAVGQGATLVQDIPTELGSHLHAGPNSEPVSHTILYTGKDPSSPIGRIFGGKKRLKISWSDHHQATLIPPNSKTLRIGAVSEEPKPVTEAVEFLGPGGEVRGFGLQFHAERDEDPDITKRVYDVVYEEMDKSRRKRVGSAARASCPGLFHSIAGGQ